MRWDPQSASEAELRTMEQHLDELGREVALARQNYEKEKQEADAIQALSQQRMAAAEQLQGQMDAETDPGRRAELEKSLGTLVTMLEQMTPEIEREKKDAADAKDFLEMLERPTPKPAASCARRAPTSTGAARHGPAAQQREQAERQAEAARRAAGLAGTTSGLTVALKAMQDTAAKDLASADAAMSKAKLLRPTEPEQDDPNIAAAWRSRPAGRRRRRA